MKMFIFRILFILCIYLTEYNVNGVIFNIALNQTIKTSSIVANHPAYMATDQKLSTYVQVDYVQDVPAWIVFDLRLYVFIDYILIWPTNDTDFELAKASVYLTFYSSIEKYLDAFFCSYNNPVRGVPYNCTGPQILQDTFIGYVHLIKESFFSSETLKIAEIAIITQFSESRFKNWKSAEQSNGKTGKGLSGPENAFDHDSLTCIYTDQTDVSMQNIRGWWRTDLEQSYEIFGFRIYDHNTNNQSYRGNYLLYIDTIGFTKKELCAYDNQTLTSEPKFVRCQNVLNGRYITVERVVTNAEANRLDMLSFCQIRLSLNSNERIYTSPQNYLPVVLNPTTTIISIDAFTNAYTTIDDSSLKEKIIIGVVTGCVAAILFGLIFAIICYQLGSSMEKKRITKQMNVYQRNNTNNAYAEIYDTTIN